MAHEMDIIDEAALDWVVRLGDPGFADWDAFTAWLEADARHAERYHALEADAAGLAGLIPAPRPAPPPLVEPRRSSRRGWIAGALAASVAGVIGYGALHSRADPYVVETAPGMTRTISLADGSRIALNGGTRLVLDHGNARIASLDRGEAYFTIRHDAAEPFRVTVGGDELLDVGTAFNVVRDGDGLRVGVAEGAVMLNPRNEAVRLDAGRGLETDGRTIRLAAVAPGSVGGWRNGMLDYDGAPLAQVVADLSRALGLTVTAAPALAARPFQGTIALDGLRDDPAKLASLLNVRVRRAGTGWEIVPLP